MICLSMSSFMDPNEASRAIVSQFNRPSRPCHAYQDPAFLVGSDQRKGTSVEKAILAEQASPAEKARPVEKVRPAEKVRPVEKTRTVKKGRSPEKTRPEEQGRSAEKTRSTEKRSPMEKTRPVEKGRSAVEKGSTETGRSAEKARSTETGSPVEKTTPGEKGRSAEKTRPVEKDEPADQDDAVPKGKWVRIGKRRVWESAATQVKQAARRDVAGAILANAIMLCTTSDAAREPREEADRFFTDLAQANGENPAALLAGVREAVSVRRSTYRVVCKFVVRP